MTGAAVVWLWEWRAADGRVLLKGDYHARPYASAADIAAERVALLVAQRVGRSRGSEAVEILLPMAGMVCRVWPEGDPDNWAEVGPEEWIEAARAAV